MQSVPVIDVKAALDGENTAVDKAAEAIDSACLNSGFFIITGTGITRDLVDRVMAAGRVFFALPYEEKQKVAPPGPDHYRGYLGLDTTSLAATLGEEVPPDLCESFNINRFDDPEARDRAWFHGAHSTFHPNLWPSEPPELRPLLEEYYRVMEKLCFKMLPIFARALGLPPAWFNKKVEEHTALLLINWYPPISNNVHPNQLRRGGHTDYGAFTVVAAEQTPGLQIFTENNWNDVPAIADSFVVNLGDLMARWTNDRWVSTLHRVVVPEGKDRYRDRMSVPYFFQPSYGAIIETIPTTITENNPKKYKPVVSGEWIKAKSMSMLED